MTDLYRCELCPAEHPTEEMHNHGDVDLCPACHENALKIFRECDHDWKPDEDECGEPAQSCIKCGALIPDEEFENIIGVNP